MKALFIGGTGLISTAVSKLTIEQGIDLYLLTRGTRDQFAPQGATLLQGDINKDTESVAKVLEPQTFDVVVNWVAFTTEQIERDIELFKGKTSQYIFISSASAYQKPGRDYLVTESTPLVNPHWQYSRNKIACEDRLLQEHRNNGFPVTIVRPSLTFGDPMIPAGFTSWRHPWTLIDRMQKGQKIIVHGDGSSLWQITHNSDFAKGFVPLMANWQTIAQNFHITTDEVLNWDEIYRTIGRAAGVDEIDILHVPTETLMAYSPNEEGNLLGDKAVSCVLDNTKLKRFAPGYTATTSFYQGVSQSIEFFRQHPEKQIIDEQFNALSDQIIHDMEQLHEGAREWREKMK
jgi:nucleoside-diphosphate-sugar epimerase